MSVIKQLFTEFWFPFVVALAWTMYKFLSLQSDNRSFTVAVDAFSLAFFFVSWLFSQWFRVRKQQKVEGGLSSIEASVKQTLIDLEAKTANLAGYITGGDSYAHLVFSPRLLGPETHEVRLRCEGSFAIYDLTVFVDDIDIRMGRAAADKIEATLEALTGSRSSEIGTLVPDGVGRSINWKAPGYELDERRIDVRFFARNGQWRQELRWRLTETGWSLATRVVKGDGSPLYEHVDEGFPRHPSGAVLW